MLPYSFAYFLHFPLINLPYKIFNVNSSLFDLKHLNFNQTNFFPAYPDRSTFYKNNSLSFCWPLWCRLHPIHVIKSTFPWSFPPFSREQNCQDKFIGWLILELYPTRTLYELILNCLQRKLIAKANYWVAKPSRNLGFILWDFSFSVSGKVLPSTPLLSGGFVHRAFWAYIRRIERVVGNA